MFLNVTLQQGNRQALEQERLSDIRNLHSGNADPLRGPVEELIVNQDGIIINGHHRVFDAIDNGLPVDVIIQNQPMIPGKTPIRELPIIPRR